MILVLGIDGADWSVVNSLIERGEMPTLATLIENGADGTLRSTIPAYTGIALPTIMTGKSPGTTGMVGFESVDGQLNDFSHIDSETFWETAGRQGTSSCIVNVRTTYPPRPVDNGLLVSGDLYTPPDADDYVYPPGLMEEHPELRSFHEHLDTLDELQHDQDIEKFLSTAITSSWERYETFKTLVKANDPDVAMFYIGNLDKLQHLAFGSEEVTQFYREVDDMLGNAVETLEPSTTYVFSDHGFEAVYEEELHLNSWLAKEGYLTTTRIATVSRRLGPLVSKYGPDLVKSTALTLTRRLSSATTGDNENEDPGDEDCTSGDEAAAYGRDTTIPGINYDESQAVLANEWGIDVLTEQADRESIVEQLVNDLRQLQINGKSAIRFVAPREEVYTEPYRYAFPDIVVLPERRFHLNHTLSTDLVTNSSGSDHNAGYHIYNPNGIFVADGDGIEPRSDVVVSAEDFAPTLIHALGDAIPDDIDGSPVHAVLPETQQNEDVETIESVSRAGIRDDGLDEDVEKRLEGMGYL